MSDSPPIPLDQWVHYYQQQATGPPVTSAEVSDSTTTTITTADNSSTTAGGHLSPQAARPVRRRSRASRRTPTTLLNASATNFRSLVQQFTGCQAAASSSFVPPGRGPVNLNFGRTNERNDLTTNSVVAPSAFVYNYNQHMPPFQQQEQFQDQQSLFAYGESNTDPTPNQHSTLDDFVTNNVPLNELMEESTLTRSANDGYFY